MWWCVGKGNGTGIAPGGVGSVITADTATAGRLKLLANGVQIADVDLVAVVLAGMTAKPDAFVTALAAATNLVPINDLSGTTTHKAFPA